MRLFAILSLLVTINVYGNKLAFKKLCRHASALIASLSIFGSFAAPSIAISESLPSDVYKNVYVNAPSDDFWYPPFMIGQWKTDLKFLGATFTDKVSTEKLIKKGNLPGFDKYSIFFIPEAGIDATDFIMKYVQLDSHPREDHPTNLRSIVKAFSPDTVIDSAPYYFQKAPDWFHSPADHWDIKYHDSTGNGM